MSATPDPTPHRFFAALLQRRVFVIVIALLIAIVSLLGARRLVWREDIMDLLPDHDPQVAELRLLLDAFRPHDGLFFIVEGAVRLDTRIDAAKSLAEALRATGVIESVRGQQNEAGILDIWKTFHAHRASLFTESHAALLDERLTSAGIRATLAGWRRTLTESPAPMLPRLFARDPLLIDQPILEQLESLRGLAGGALEVREGWLVTQDEAVAVMAQPRWPSTDGARAAQVVDQVTQAVETTEAAHPDITIAWLGGHRFAFENASRVKRDVRFTLTLCVVAISVLVFLAFARPLFVVLALVPAAFGGLIAAGLVPVLVPGISAIAIGCGSMLVAIAVDYGIHVLYHAEADDAEEPGGVPGIMTRLARPLLLSASTTVAAFLVLRLSILPGYRQLGTFAALGIGGAAAFTILVLPVLLPRTRQGRGRVDFAGWYPGFCAGAMRHRKRLIVGLLVLSVLAGFGVPRVRVEGDPEKLNGLSDKTRAEADRVRDALGGVLRTTSLVVRGNDDGAALQNAARLSDALDQQGDRVKSAQSMTRFCPPPDQQTENRARWEAFWTPERIASTRRAIEKTAPDLGMKPAVVARFLDGIHNPGAPLTIEDLRVGPLAEMIDRQVARREGETFILTPVQFASDQARPESIDVLREAMPGLIAVQSEAFAAHIAELIVGELLRMGQVALVIIVVLVFVVVRRPGRVALLLLPLVLSTLWTFGLMGWLDVRINLVNSILAIFIFGLVIDYSIFLVNAAACARDATDPHLARSAGAVSVSAFTTMVGLGSMALASHPALHAIGFTALLGIGSGWLSVMLVAPLARRG